MNLLKASIFRDPIMKLCGINWIIITKLVSKIRESTSLGGWGHHLLCLSAAMCIVGLRFSLTRISW